MSGDVAPPCRSPGQEDEGRQHETEQRRLRFESRHREYHAPSDTELVDVEGVRVGEGEVAAGEHGAGDGEDETGEERGPAGDSMQAWIAAADAFRMLQRPARISRLIESNFT